MRETRETRDYDLPPEDSEEIARRWGIELEVEGEPPDWFKEKGYGPA